MNKIVIAIGDLHGCIEEFEELLRKIQYNAKYMRIVLLGDLIDRGPDSVGCVRLARQLQFESIMGNHEDKHLRWRRHEQKHKSSGKPNPMHKLSYDKQIVQQSLSEEDFSWMSSLPLKLQLLNNLWAVHGGCTPRFKLSEQPPNQIIRMRYLDCNGTPRSLGENFSQPPDTKYWAEMWNGPESIVYGHCVHDLKVPRIDDHGEYKCVGIDTGCVFGGMLTGAIFKPLANDNFEIEFAQVAAKAQYYKSSNEES